MPERAKPAMSRRADSWLLVGGRVASGPCRAEQLDIEIRAGKIAAIGRLRAMPADSHRLDLRGCLVLPGLINAHDHLEFNLFPRLGDGPYPNAGAWARDIYHPERSPIREQLSIPLQTRLRWGAVKNLLSGVTTVCHHNPYDPHVFTRQFGVRVARRYGWAHSLEFSPDLRRRFERTPADWPFVVHLGEAVDRAGKREIARLDGVGALDGRTVLVHAVALGARGLALVKERGASLVWCPSSNMFILGQTLSPAALDSGIRIALGTDSALSGRGDLLEEMRFARKLGRVSAARLYEMVTREAARVMRLPRGTGDVIAGGAADLLVVRDSGHTPAATLLELATGGMEMVFVGGQLMVAARRLRLPEAARRRLRPVVVGTRIRRRVSVAIDLPGIYRQVEPVLGTVYLAHKMMSRTA